MAYLNTTTMQYPLTEQDVREANKAVSFPSPFVAPAGYVWVYPSPVPQYDSFLQRAEETVPVDFDGMWYQAWQIVNLYATQEEADAAVAQRLAVAKEAKSEEIDAERLAADYGTFSCAGVLVACDQLNREYMDGVNGYVSIFSSLPPDWGGSWKTVEGWVMDIPDVDSWKQFYGFMVANLTSNYQQAQTLKDALTLAQNLEEVAAVTWPNPVAP